MIDMAYWGLRIVMVAACIVIPWFVFDEASEEFKDEIS